MAIYLQRRSSMSATFIVYDKSAIPGWVASATDLVKPTDTRSQEDGMKLALAPLEQLGLCSYEITPYSRQVKGIVKKIEKLGDEAKQVTITCRTKRATDTMVRLIEMMDNPADISIDSKRHPKAGLLTDAKFF